MDTRTVPRGTDDAVNTLVHLVHKYLVQSKARARVQFVDLAQLLTQPTPCLTTENEDNESQSFCH